MGLRGVGPGRRKGEIVDSQALNAGRSAYREGDFATAQALLSAAKGPGEVNGEIDHLRGNALMRIGRYDEAARAYADALQDPSYGKAGALATNLGRAYLAAGKPEAAVTSLNQALNDRTYATPYKAQMALGEAYEALGQTREAGAAWRNAAIDESNPDPSAALARLGRSFMQLGRPMDAIEAYRTALDFSTPAASQNAVYADLGEAYVAANRMPEAQDAFSRALADGTYRLTATQQAASTASANALAAISARPQSDTDAMLQAAGYGTPSPYAAQGGSGAIDPLDPLGSSGEFIPSPEDTGFFEVSERDIMENARQRASVERKNKHTGLKVFIALLVVVILVAAAGAGLYFTGYGWPTQEAVVEGVFQSQTSGEDLSPYLASGLSEEEAAQIASLIPAGATISIDGVDRSMNESTVSLTATLAEGGTQSYLIELVREGIGWKISSVELSFDSLADAGTVDATITSDTSPATDSAEAAQDEGDIVSADEATDEVLGTDQSILEAGETTDQGSDAAAQPQEEEAAQ